MLAIPNADVKCWPNLVRFVNFINYKLIDKTPSFTQNKLPWKYFTHDWASSFLLSSPALLPTLWALYSTEPAFLREIFVLLTSQTPQEGICQPKKSHKVSKILPVFGWLDWHYLDDIDLFESLGLRWGLEPKN